MDLSGEEVLVGSEFRSVPLVLLDLALKLADSPRGLLVLVHLFSPQLLSLPRLMTQLS